MDDSSTLSHASFLTLKALIVQRSLPVLLSWSEQFPEAETVDEAIASIKRAGKDPGISSFHSGCISISSASYKNANGEPFAISFRVADVIRCGFMISTRSGEREGFYLMSGRRSIFSKKTEIELFVHSNAITVRIGGKATEYSRMMC